MQTTRVTHKALSVAPAHGQIFWLPFKHSLPCSIRFWVASCPWRCGIMGRFFIDGVNLVVQHQPLPQHFWWLVGAEMILAVLTGMLSRTVDYCDNLLADRYTHHGSVEGI